MSEALVLDEQFFLRREEEDGKESVFFCLNLSEVPFLGGLSLDFRHDPLSFEFGLLFFFPFFFCKPVISLFFQAFKTRAFFVLGCIVSSFDLLSSLF